MGLADEANEARRRQARSRLANTPAGRLLRSLADLMAGRGRRASVRRNLQDFRDEQTREQLREMEAKAQQGLTPQDRALFEKEFKNLGPVGDVLLRMLSGNASKTLDRRYYDLAKGLIEASGGRVVDNRADLDDIMEARRLYEFQSESDINRLAEQRRFPQPPRIDPQGEEIPEPGMSAAIYSPQSSNVYSVQYDFAKSSLYVTFKANEINSKAVQTYRGRGNMISGAGDLGRTNRSTRKNEPGSRYEYFDVPVRVWKLFENASSKGKTVWDKLRVRGTIHGHQYRYRLVGAMVAVGDDGKRFTYVPRKATKNGFASRSLATIGKTGKRGYANATLPEQRKVNRARPNQVDRGR